MRGGLSRVRRKFLLVLFTFPNDSPQLATASFAPRWLRAMIDLNAIQTLAVEKAAKRRPSPIRLCVLAHTHVQSQGAWPELHELEVIQAGALLQDGRQCQWQQLNGNATATV
jgi:hypothetical protein